MKITLISDTHGAHRKVLLPGGDILIHAGDSLSDGWDFGELQDFLSWFGKQSYKHKVLIAGNHDWLFQTSPSHIVEMCEEKGIVYLQDSECTVEGLKIWGSPWQPEFCGWAFNLPRGKSLEEKWSLIPNNTDILVTHGPAYGVRDWVHPVHRPQNLGCLDLAKRIDIVKPLIHVFGHIHGGYGITESNTLFVNAAIMNEAYKPVNTPTIITLKRRPENGQPK